MRPQASKVRYIHHDVKTIERQELVRDLRLGVYDVLVGINLLRENLDIPEVSLVAILDADKEGFLGRRPRSSDHRPRRTKWLCGMVVLYADNITPSMKRAMDETERRRALQDAFNKAHGIIPRSVHKKVQDVIEITSNVPSSSKKRKRCAARAKNSNRPPDLAR
ncbi:helicase-related protein [Agathobaculum butyriciproducens]|uniref:helicase-related protein n=1 Tax=Agathobaculum butyriciproducens TaxID=1628085 RepID=UPI0036D37217